MDPTLQLYDLRSPEEAPCTIAFHPTRPALFCGFSSGAVRSFSLEAAEVLVEHRWVPSWLQPHRHPWRKLRWYVGSWAGQERAIHRKPQCPAAPWGRRQDQL